MQTALCTLRAIGAVCALFVMSGLVDAATPLGCFKDQGDPQGTNGRDLAGFMTFAPNMTGNQCTATCSSRGFAYAGTQYGGYCFCGNEYGRFGPAPNCNVPCAGNPGEMCGGAWANTVYRLTATKLSRQLVQRPLPLNRLVAPAARMCVELPKPPGQLPAKASRNFLQIAPDGSVVGVNRGPLASIPDALWDPGQTLRVRFSGGSAALRARIQHAADEWRPHANIRFSFVADDAPAEIRIAFDTTGGSWSFVGREALLVGTTVPTMNFGWLTDDTDDTEVHRVVVHEFGHALGLIHEHQSPVAGIPWDVPKVYAWYLANMGWDQAMVDANVLTKANVTTTNYSAFDPTSIMEYPVPAELTLDHSAIGWNTGLSSMDKTAIRLWYPFPTVSRGQLQTNDDCDLIDFTLTEGVVPPGQFLVRLGTGGPVNWWKSISVPFSGGGLQQIEVGGIGAESRWVFWRNVMDESRPIEFAKAKVLGVHTRLGFTWNVIRALPDGGELQLVWVRDSCHQ